MKTDCVSDGGIDPRDAEYWLKYDDPKHEAVPPFARITGLERARTVAQEHANYSGLGVRLYKIYEIVRPEKDRIK